MHTNAAQPDPLPALMDGLPMAMLQVDGRGRVLYLNPSAQSAFEVESTWAGVVDDLLVPTDGLGYQLHGPGLCGQRHRFDVEIRCGVMQGRIVHVDSGPSVKGPAYRDLLFSVTESSSTMHALPQLVWATDACFDLRFVSCSLVNLFNRVDDPWRGRRLWDWLAVADHQRMAKVFEFCAQAHRPVTNLRVCARHGSGHACWLRLHAEPMLDAAGRLLGYRGVAEDITETQLARLASRRRDQFMVAMGMGSEVLADLEVPWDERLGRCLEIMGQAMSGDALMLVRRHDAGQSDDRLVEVERWLAGHLSSIEPIAWPVDELLVHWITEAGSLHGLASVRDQAPPAVGQWMRDAGLFSVQMVPVRAGIQVDQWLLLFSGDRDFDWRQTRFLQAFADRLVVALDRHDQRRQIVASEKRFRAVLKAAGEYVWEIDDQFRFTFVSERVVDVMGRSVESLLGTTPMAYMPEADARRVVAHFGRCLADGQPFRDLEFRVILPDGRIVWQRVNGEPIRDALDRLVGYRGAALDITDARAAAEHLEEKTLALAESQQRLRTALASSNAGLWDWQIDQDQIYFDDTWFSMLGYDPGELPATVTTWERLILPEYVERFWQAIRSYWQQPTGMFELIYPAVHRQGHVVWILSRGRVVAWDDHGVPGRMVGTNQDITELRQLQEQLSAMARRAEQANEAKSAFLANVSHEIRTPMTAILGFTDLLMDASTNVQQREDYVKTIRRNGRHLLSVVNDLLDLSKIEAGQLSISRQPTPFTELIGDIFRTMRPRAEDAGLSYGLEYVTEIPGTVHTDPLRVKQVMLNLIGNAVKFTPAGSVTVTVACLIDRVPMIRIQVHDTGVGIAPDRIGQLFRPFVQADESTTRRFGGTGLGLALSRELAQMLGGDVTVVSELGVGSVFTFTFDPGMVDDRFMLDPGDLVLDTDEPHTVSRTLSGHVLLAEDGPDNQRLIRYVLEQMGLTVSVADNGRQAVNCLLNPAPSLPPVDLVLMDIQMPILDGYQATSELRSAGVTCPIIALTAHAMSEERDRCLAVGCNDWATKPIDRNVLRRLLSCYLCCQSD